MNLCEKEFLVFNQFVRLIFCSNRLGYLCIAIIFIYEIALLIQTDYIASGYLVVCVPVLLITYVNARLMVPFYIVIYIFSNVVSN